MTASERHRVYELNRPLTVLGCDRGPFFVALLCAAVIFEASANLPVAAVVAAVLIVCVRLLTVSEPRLISILRHAGPLRTTYDPFLVDEKCLGPSLDTKR